jgi:2,3-dihydroxybenzoate-AMP ligase
VAFFQLSGGSTGTPKLIPRTHNDYDYSIRRSNEICGITAETRYLNALPAAHNYAMSSPGSLGVFRRRLRGAGERSERHPLLPAD